MVKVTVFQFLLEIEQALQTVGTETFFALHPHPRCERFINYRENRATLQIVQPAYRGRPARLVAQVLLQIVPHEAAVLAFSCSARLPHQDWRDTRLVLLRHRDQLRTRAFDFAEVLRKAYRAPMAEAETPTRVPTMPLAAAV